MCSSLVSKYDGGLELVRFHLLLSRTGRGGKNELNRGPTSAQSKTSKTDQSTNNQAVILKKIMLYDIK